ncbi:MAG TPA: extracellular solute-binding protein [Rhodothermales bacterium]|nr:iron ABC transporter substrate-binding protein [Bacteroidota bacterium]HRK74281.1 extracellular solute-binding protein [Rhodothermales bacterium]HRR08743.1 extracellular solute-binding protein [Rhodothermales bacterium]
MKRFGIGLLVLLMMGCVEDSRKKVVVYSPHGKDLLKAYEQAFEAQNPQMDVVWLDMGAQAVYERIRTEAANPQADLWWGAPNILFQQAAEEGLLAAYRPTWADQVEGAFRDERNRWYGNFLTPVGIAFNAETVKEPPQKWDELLDPKWKGRILVRYPLESGTMVALFGALVMRQKNEIEGLRWLAKLDQQTKTYTADPTQLYIKLARQEGDLTLWNLPDILLQQKKGNPFGISFPANETPVLIDAIALVKGGRNQKEAIRFYEFVTSQEAMRDQAEEMYRIPVRKDIPPERLPAWIREYPISAMTIDWQVLGKRSKGWMKQWDEQVKGRGAAFLAEAGTPSNP